MKRIALLGALIYLSILPALGEDAICHSLICDGYHEMQVGHFQRAATLFGQVVNRDPKNAAGRRYLAAALTNIGAPSTALQEITAAQAIDGKKSYDELLLGDAYVVLQNFQAARTHYIEAHKDGRLSTPAAIGLARIAVAQNDYDEAREICDQLAFKKLNPKEQIEIKVILKRITLPAEALQPTPGNS